MLTIYGVPISVHTRKVIVAANAKDLDYRIEPVIPFDPPPDWPNLSPTGRIPALRDGDETLADSSVICTWLERTRPDCPLYPEAPRALVQALWLEEYCDGTLFRDLVHGLFLQKVIRPRILEQPTDVAQLDRLLQEVRPRLFDYLEGQMTGGFLVGSNLCIADIAVVSNLLNYRYLGYEIDEYLYPKLAGYLRRSLNHPAVASAVRAERPFAEQMGLDVMQLN